ncbi:teashirt homolog 1 [Acanthopagrus latus]|uniref:teashirt homolog 1 n=1 Tax=Acanthopagrus latus TaxID=8177 RepID=UPI00187BE7AF|nr:teashirt homolog 1 [Acanthopagrus latus]XP_036949202.1 teashirt homolog 1 [Acanthopagrus latus]XP_036949203.1 teashirt homolog 1 [Acanthopagrus latus]XP_036949204.1 teashirt homolog 1 [Acanthopagrus latus]XP_036949205.1 teashirt homolog 1 [Acanthopagrus latus]XP_036949206.1 teashirt homolog 1 [Acanthopagrus latus]
MPRRKQQAPRRSVAYGPEDEFKVDKNDEEEHLQDDGLSLDGQDADYLFNDDEDARDHYSCQNSPLSNGTNPDAGYASPLSTTSDQLVDLKTTSSSRDQDKVKEKLGETAESINGVSLQDSLAQMKAVYANLISDASWSSIALDMLKSKQGNNYAASNGNGSNHKGNNGFLNSHSPVSIHLKSRCSTSNASATTNITTSSTTTRTVSSNSNSGTSVSSGSTGGLAYDWHQAALAKTLQHTPYQLLPEPSLFSTVQLYRQNNKLYGPVFTGASKFRCKDCSAAYDTLVGLTVHMNETGHYRDDNKDTEDDRSKKWSKPRKRSLMEMEGKEDAQKVLKCMYCGHSFESLQDLSVHMIKTKHYQKVPLKEPMPALTSKIVPPTKKRAFQDLMSPSSPESVSSGILLGESPKDQKVANPYVTPNNRYGYQNGASYTWQFEARKAQILKCMECGSSHDTLQQLTAHMMVTGHFLKVTNSASKKGKQLVFDPVVEEKIQSIPLPPTTTRLPAPNGKSQPGSPLQPASPNEEDEEMKDEKAEEEKTEAGEPEKKIKEEKEDPPEKAEKRKARSYQYLREEDLEEAPKGGLDILKSLENTVSSAISKAQTGTPTWGGYPSIHAAYQLHGSLKSNLPSCAQVQPLFSSNSLKVLSSDLGTLVHSPDSPSPPPSQKSNVLAMEELVEKVTGKTSIKSEKEEKPAENKCRSAKSPLPNPKEKRASPKPENLSKAVKHTAVEVQTDSRSKEGEQAESKVESQIKSEVDSPKRPVSNGCSNLSIITDHSPEQPLVNPLSALQSIMNNHLGKAAKVTTPFSDPFAMLYKINSNSAQMKSAEPVIPDSGDDDQPMDLTKSKNANGSTPKGISTANNNDNSKQVFKSFSQSSSPPLRENALMDISDMVKNLTGRLTPKSTTPSSISEKSDMDGCTFEDSLEELSPIQRRKGRQSNWNPQHLLILQAQFASSLRETPDGKFVIADLGPQERVHICKFTGLSMTTISHWLANVKYQLKRTGSTKFLKNIDSGQPLFLCSDCASQFRTPSSYIHHLESHLGFTLKDLSNLSIDLIDQQAVSRIEDKTFSGLTEEDTGSVYQCKLCNRTFMSKHAIKLHLCKTHGKSPEDHLIFVKELDKQ